MKSVLKWVLGILGFIIGLFGLMFGVLAGGGVHIKYHWSAYFFFSMLLPFLTPYAFIQLLSYKQLIIETTWDLLKVTIVLDLVFIASMFVERSHLPIFFDLSLMVVLWSIWQFALVLAYFLKVRSSGKS